MKPGSNPRDRPGARWWNAPRSSSERITLRGEVREAEASVVAHPAFARSGHPVRAERARGSASRSSARTTKEVRGNWFEEGLLPPKRRREPSLDPVRSTQGSSLRRRSTCEARQPVPSPQGGGRRLRQGEVRHLLLQNEESKQLAVGARASSYCRSRQNALGLREARHQSRSGRKPGRYPERVNGSLTIGGRSGAQAQGPTGGKRGADHREARRSSSRERRVFDEGSVVSFVLRRERDARSDCRRKAPWVGEAHAFHEAPAEPALAASESQASGRRNATRAGGEEEATGVSEAVGIDSTRRKKTPPREDRPVAEVGTAP